MRSIIKSSFLWQFGGGFVLGAIGLVALQPADALRSPSRGKVGNGGPPG